MIKIDYNTAVSTANEIIAEAGSDHVYERKMTADNLFGTGTRLVCSYLEADEDGGLTVPSCIVGRILHKLGVKASDMEPYNTGSTASQILGVLATDKLLTFTPKASAFLSKLQMEQDDMEAWGDAMLLSVEEVARFKWNDEEQNVGLADYVRTPAGV